jgi:diguanylate cyclase (GGDEF)-like protein/PAS domain S-box-containing protein
MQRTRPATPIHQWSRKAPLRWFLVIPFVLQISVAVGLTGWLSIRNGQQAVNDVASQLRREVSSRIKEHLDHHLTTSIVVNQMNSELISQGLLSTSDLSEMRQHFWRQLHIFESMGVIYFGNEQGQFIAAQRLDDETFIFVKREQPPAIPEVYTATEQGMLGEYRGTIDDFIDIRQRPWYLAARTADQLTWGDIFALQVVPRIDLPASVPVVGEDGELQGVLGNNLALGAISDFLQDVEVGKSGQTFIIEPSGELVASSALPQPFTVDQTGRTQRIQAVDSENIALRSTVTALQERFGSLERIEAARQFNTVIDGERQFVEVLPYQDEWGLDWLIVVVVPESDFLGQIQANTRNTILLSLGAFSLATAAGIAIARWLTFPILQLNQATKAVTEGDLTPTVQTDRTRELGELAYSFSQMVTQLQESFTQLQSLNIELANSESRLTQFLEALPVGVAVHEQGGGLAYLNQVGHRLLNIESVPILESEPAAIPPLFYTETHQLYPADLLPIARALRGEMTHLEDIEVHFSDRTVPLEIWATPIFDEQGQVKYAIAAFQDITERKRAEAAIRDSESRYRLLAENMNDLVCLHRPDGRYVYVSPSCESVLGYTYEDMVDRNPYQFFHPDDCDRIRRESHQMALAKLPEPITYRMRQKSGQYIWLETLTKPILDEQGNIVRLQTTSRDVTDRVQVQEQLKHDALHDSLTGLPNRTMLLQRLELALARSQREPEFRFAVLFLDLDHFKVINDSLGHLAGDQLLIMTARKLEQISRAEDLVARLGGDEFVVLLEELHGIEDAIQIAERILTVLYAPWLLEEREVVATTSIGLVEASPRYRQASDLLRDADIALYRAKHNGRARYEIFDPQMHLQVLKRLHVENDLRKALEHEEFRLHYQPIVSLQTGNLAGFEALIRWQHPRQGLLGPHEFIPIAEEIGLILPIGRWVIKAACEQMMAWRHCWPMVQNLKISVNLSAQQLQDQFLPEQVNDILTATGFSGNCLTLELTESMLIEHADSTIELLNRLKAQGIRMSIDDFGTGYSSLSYLNRLPIDVLKIDRSFVQQMAAENNDDIVKTIIALSNALRLAVVAEGIETPQQQARLHRLGCEFGQGYLYAKPLPPDAAEQLFTTRPFG